MGCTDTAKESALKAVSERKSLATPGLEPVSVIRQAFRSAAQTTKLSHNVSSLVDLTLGGVCDGIKGAAGRRRKDNKII